MVLVAATLLLFFLLRLFIVLILLSWGSQSAIFSLLLLLLCFFQKTKQKNYVNYRDLIFPLKQGQTKWASEWRTHARAYAHTQCIHTHSHFYAYAFYRVYFVMWNGINFIEATWILFGNLCCFSLNWTELLLKLVYSLLTSLNTHTIGTRLRTRIHNIFYELYRTNFENNLVHKTIHLCVWESVFLVFLLCVQLH